MAFYTDGNQLEWREVESGKLPSPRGFLRASLVDNTIFITGGTDGGYAALTTILSWDPSSESWQQAGVLPLGRSGHAAVTVPSSIIESECLAAKLLRSSSCDVTECCLSCMAYVLFAFASFLFRSLI